MGRNVLLLLLLALAPRLCWAAASPPFSSPRDEVRLISATNETKDGKIKLALEFNLKPGWHIYWRNPGDAGFPPTVSAKPPVVLGPIAFPPPEFLSQNGVGAYVLSGHVVLPFTASRVAENGVAVEARWLACADVCVPEHASFTLALSGGASAEAGLFPTAPASIPSPYAAHLAPDGTLTLAGLTPRQVKTARFFPDAATVLVNDAPQRLSFGPEGMRLRLKLAGTPPPTLTGVLELTDPSGQTQALNLTAAPAAPAHVPWWLLALLGGLVLNLMPCVFPVLAMKGLAFARLGGAAYGHIRREALGYAAGVMVSMAALGGLLLGLRQAGEQVFWGFQFHSPIFVAAAGWMMLAAGLSLAGAFHVSVPGFIGRLPAQHSFFTGLLAVLVATPCTAPFMGAALAAAFALPFLPAFTLFLALGAGLALPILILAFLPQLAALLPRPGRWMAVAQKVLAIPMFGSFAWLVWVLYLQAGPQGLILALVGAAILVLAVPRRPAFALVLVALLLFLRPGAADQPGLSLPNARPYSASTLADLRAAGRPVFIDLTAAWCITCQVNERTTLSAAPVQTLFRNQHVAVLVGDWTDRNPDITALLEENHRAGVPLYLYYPPGGAPKLLPQILTPGIVVAALSG